MRWIKVTPRSHSREEGGGGRGVGRRRQSAGLLSYIGSINKKIQRGLKGKNLRRVVQSTFKQAGGWSENVIMMRNLNSTLFILICSNALYTTLRGTLARLHWAVYDFIRNFAGTPMWCLASASW